MPRGIPQGFALGSSSGTLRQTVQRRAKLSEYSLTQPYLQSQAKNYGYSKTWSLAKTF